MAAIVGIAVGLQLADARHSPAPAEWLRAAYERSLVERR